MYKCQTCNKLDYTAEIDCETPTKCNIMECVSICYASSSGIGILVGKAQTTITNQDNTKTVVTEDVKLRSITLS